MAEHRPEDRSGVEQQLRLLQHLQELARQQDAAHQALQTEHERLQRAVAKAAARLTAMVSGARASRGRAPGDH